METIVLIQHVIKTLPFNDTALGGALGDGFFEVSFGQGVVFAGNAVADQHHALQRIDPFCNSPQLPGGYFETRRELN